MEHMTNRVFTFVEPHLTGGDCVVTITEEQIMKHMIKMRDKNPKMKDVSDDDLLDYFLVNHWCVEKK
jgi:hypothetical protein